MSQCLPPRSQSYHDVGLVPAKCAGISPKSKGGNRGYCGLRICSLMCPDKAVAAGVVEDVRRRPQITAGWSGAARKRAFHFLTQARARPGTHQRHVGPLEMLRAAREQETAGRDVLGLHEIASSVRGITRTRAQGSVPISSLLHRTRDDLVVNMQAPGYAVGNQKTAGENIQRI